MTAPTTAPPTSDIPPWVSHVLTVALPLASILAAKLGLRNSAVDAQSAVMIAGLIAGLIAHAVGVVSRNGLTKAGIQHTVSEEEAQLKANMPALRQAFADATTIINSIPGGASAVSTIGSQLRSIQAQVDAIPATQRQAAAEALQLWMTGGQNVGGTTNTNPPSGPPPVATPPPTAG